MRPLARLFSLLVFLFIYPVHADAPVAPEVTPDQALQRLIDGNKRFVSGQAVHPRQDQARRAETAKGQKPFASILSCSDSRVPPEVIFDNGLGDLFVVRVAGNTVNNEALGSLEYGASVLGAPLIVVLGHEKCGAVDAALQGKPLPGHIPTFVTPIESALQGGSCKKEKEPLSCSVHANVDYVVDQIRTKDPTLSPLVKAGKLKVVGAVYDLATGEVKLQP